MTTYPKLLNMDTGIHAVHHADGTRYKVWYHVNGRKRYLSLHPRTRIEEARARRDEIYAELMADGATEATHKDVKPRGPKPGQGKYIYKRPPFVVRRPYPRETDRCLPHRRGSGGRCEGAARCVERLAHPWEEIITKNFMSQENEIAAENSSQTPDFLPSDGSSCSLVADTRPKIVIDNVTHFMDGPLLSLSNVLDHAATAERIRAEMKS